MTARSFLYLAARLLGDATAIRNKRVTERVHNRLVGKLAGRLTGRVWK